MLLRSATCRIPTPAVERWTDAAARALRHIESRRTVHARSNIGFILELDDCARDRRLNEISIGKYGFTFMNPVPVPVGTIPITTWVLCSLIDASGARWGERAAGAA